MNDQLPTHEDGDGTPHSGAALHLFATGVAHRVVKADVASLYPSLMREYRIGPARDSLGAMLSMVDRLVEQRLAAKASARAAPRGSAERFTFEAMSAAMKIVVNSAYGYLGAGGGLTRFADVHAANEVTRRGRETLNHLCTALAARGVTLLEADTDGVYFAVPKSWSEADERRVVATVYVDAALAPQAGRAGLAPATFLAQLRRLADEHGILPPWTQWWGDVADLFPDAATRQAVEREQPRLPLSYFTSRIPGPAGWSARGAAYLAFGDTYAEERDRANRRGWPTRTLAGGHLHALHEPAEVGTAILDLSRSAAV